MSDDAKEWKTVKIEAPVRDDAQADPRTYSEIMRAGLDETPADTDPDPPGFDEINERLEGKLLTESQAKELMNTSPDEMREQLDRIEDAAREATNAAQNAERAAEELAGQR